MLFYLCFKDEKDEKERLAAYGNEILQLAKLEMNVDFKMLQEIAKKHNIFWTLKSFFFFWYKRIDYLFMCVDGWTCRIVQFRVPTRPLSLPVSGRSR